MKKMMCEAQAQAVMMMEANMAKQVTRWKEDLKKEKEKKEKEKSVEGADTQAQDWGDTQAQDWGDDWPEPDIVVAPAPTFMPTFISAGGSSPSSSSTCRVKGTGKKICLPVMKEKRKKDKDDWGP